MADKDQIPAPASDAVSEQQMRAARPGVKDEGDIVTTAGGEPMNGLVADIADGDT